MSNGLEDILWVDTPELIGSRGEALTCSALRQFSEVKLIRNIYLPYEEYFTQIDIIALSPYGVFVIENKNYHAVIEGKTEDKYLKVFYPSGRTERLYNPVLQNARHMGVVKRLLRGIIDSNIYNTVIFNEICNKSRLIDKGYCYTPSEFVNKYKEVRYKTNLRNDQLKKAYDLLYLYSDSSNFMSFLHETLLKYRRFFDMMLYSGRPVSEVDFKAESLSLINELRCRLDTLEVDIKEDDGSKRKSLHMMYALRLRKAIEDLESSIATLD